MSTSYVPKLGQNYEQLLNNFTSLSELDIFVRTQEVMLNSATCSPAL
jgi:hypothetical protein